MKRFGLYGPNSRDFLTLGQKILWHTDKDELEFLTGGSMPVRELPGDIPQEQTLHISQHPEMAAVRWPLNRKDFRRA